MLKIRGVKEEVLELLEGDPPKEELAEHIEQLVWARLYDFDEKLVELGRQLNEAKERVAVGAVILPFLAGFSLACLGCLVVFWGC